MPDGRKPTKAKSPTKKKATTKRSAKKTPARKTPAKKAAKKTTAKKKPAEKTAAKKKAAKKTAAKKTAAKKTTAKKTTAKKTTAKKTAAKPRRSARTARALPAASVVREPDFITISGAGEHNLDIEELAVPKRQLVVFTGVSGSGKSSLAFDTLYAEGQRRYVESLSAYARQFLGQLDRPQVEKLTGLSPTIAIEQKAASNNPRSTVGTITEIYDYLRVLYARVGVQHCTVCGKVVKSSSPAEVVDELMSLDEGTKLTLLAPLVVHRKGEFANLFKDLQAKGFVRARTNGEVHRLEDAPKLDKKFKHNIELVIDRIKVKASDRRRITESVELALREGKGEMWALRGNDEQLLKYSQARTCHGISYPELSPQSFSFNSPVGCCPACNGLGTRTEVDPELVVPDTSLTINEGAIAPWASAVDRESGWTYRIIEAMSQACDVDLDTPWKKLPKRKRQLVLYGVKGKRIRVEWGEEGTDYHGSWGMKYEGVIPTLERRYAQTNSESARQHYRKYFAERPCEVCGGHRLRPESLAVRVGGIGIHEVTQKTVSNAYDHFDELELRGNNAKISEGVLREIRNRIKFLLDVGLNYLTLDRSGPTLSGGEAQRIRLASQLGSELSGVMYVLDEPSIGLHQRDNMRLIQTLQRLRDLGNSVVVVEHDEDTIRASDFVVDFGPGAGLHGGKVVFAGTPEQMLEDKESLTGQYLSGELSIAAPKERRALDKGSIWIRGAQANNLDNIDVEVPLGGLVAITGVSGAGKSSLISGTLLPALSRHLHASTAKVGKHKKIEGLEALDKVISIDQRPIGRTPRSNPGTYTKAFDEIRNVFAQLPESRARGWKGGRFSFNVAGGRCEACSGDGVVKVEMHFLADVYVPCEVCHGKRYNEQTLGVRYKGKTIADVLDSSIDECMELFEHHPKLRRILQTLLDVGLGYMKIGQTATTMSGGEAQRVKLSRELAKRQTGRTLYVLDEPTTGLHFHDIARLLEVLQRLASTGNTVLVIEHNLDVIKCADWVIDLGPEGGAGGGTVVAQGTPEDVARSKASHTGRFLKELLNQRKKARA